MNGGNGMAIRTLSALALALILILLPSGSTMAIRPLDMEEQDQKEPESKSPPPKGIIPKPVMEQLLIELQKKNIPLPKELHNNAPLVSPPTEKKPQIHIETH
jgi:hypothetical protein